MLITVTLVFAMIACGAVSAGEPLVDNQSGTVSGGLYVNASTDWGPTTYTQSNTLPNYTSIQSAKVYVNTYSGSGNPTYALDQNTKIDANGDGDYDDAGENLGTEHLVWTGESTTNDPTVYPMNDHVTRCYSDYQSVYDVTNLITGNNVNIQVTNTAVDGYNFDGRIKMIALAVAYNDGDNDKVDYWVLNGQDWIAGGGDPSTSTFNTTRVETGFSNATLDTVAASSADGTYRFNENTVSGNLTETAGYYKEHQWDVSNYITPGASSNLTYTPGSGSLKMILATLSIREAASTPAPEANFTANTTTIIRNNTVQFTDSSTGIPTSWAWDFGDGGTSTLQNPTHTYTTAGNYTVSLTATNAGGSDTETKTGYITAVPNVDLYASGLVNTSPAYVFPGQNNTVTVAGIKNQGKDTATDILVYIYASDVNGGTTPVASTTISSLAAGATASTLSLIDPTIRPITADTVYGSSNVSKITYRVVLDPLNTILETNEANNNKTSTLKSVLYNGYCGQGLYEYNGTDINTQHVYDIRGDIVYYTQPESAYKGVGWTTRTEIWNSSNLSVPNTGTIEDVWLYLPYNWDYTDDGNPNWTIVFNGVDITNSSVAWYLDQSNYGAYANYKYGLMVFNVTSLFNRNGENSLVMNPLDGNKNALYPSTLAIVYSDPNATRKQIFIGEQCDELGLSQSSYGTTLEEATAYANFTGMTIDLANVTSATLHSFAGSAGPNEGNLLFNGNTIALAAWQGTSSTASALVANVKNYLTATGNVAAIQGTTSGGMDTLQQFLVVEYADAAPVAGFTANTTIGNVPLAVQFTDASTGYVSSYAWDFDNDGITDSTDKNPSYTYSAPGTYTVKLTVTNSGGSDEEVKTGYITVNGADLIITGINPNVGTGAAFFANEPNVISVTVKNNGTVTSEATTMNVEVSGVTYTVDVPAIAAGASTTVTVTDTASHSGGDSVPVNANANPNKNIPETNTTNNSFSTSLTVYNNGYKGKQYTDEDKLNSMETQQTWEGNYDVIYSSGNTAYNSANWSEKTYQWTSSDLVIPAGATVVSARLYQSYNYNQMSADPSWTMNFNGNLVSAIATYKDAKGFGSYNFPYGLYVYDVTSLFNSAGNSMTITPEAGNNYALYGAYLIVVYQDNTTTMKKIYINDGFDMLCSRETYSVNDTEATSNSNFQDVNTSNLGNAKAIAILASAGDNGKSKFYFNGVEYTGFWNQYQNGPQTGFSTYDVTSALTNGLNTAGIQSYDPTPGNTTTYGDNMYVLGSILVAAYGPSDLTITNVNGLPANPVVGQTYTINSTITNNGAKDSGAFNVKFAGIGTQRISNLAAGTSTVLSWTWTPTTSGLFAININADRNNEVTESNENNNIYTQNVTVTDPRPDITITDVQGIPANPIAGQTYTLTVTVANIGNSAASGFNVKFAGVGTQRIDSLAAGATTTLTWIWTPTKAGDYTFSINSDRNNEITESNEANNIYTQTVIVTDNRPDITITDVTGIPANPVAGQTYTITVTVANAGNSAASGFNVKFAGNGTQRIDSLAAGATTTLTWTWTPVTGTNTININADRNYEITEANEANNIYLQTVSVS
ncbi:DUF3344 domain-containing protein [uncultured Methanobacterium sp.]|uniref:DUF3344 domain-containing protein n=1 Tax=uncultured Methanobacterium sp. TaxID=176306 RepID=UPI002AA8C8E2|nr:DUF3344 domain-containing protein [uncultured Methanobacterium sp.]